MQRDRNIVNRDDLNAHPKGRLGIPEDRRFILEGALLLFRSPARGAVRFERQLPKTRSGNVLRRSVKAIAESQDPGDLTTLGDPIGIEQIQRAKKGHVGFQIRRKSPA